MPCQILEQLAEIDRHFANLQSIEDLYDRLHSLEGERESDQLISYHDAARAHLEDRLDMLTNGLSFVEAESIEGASLQLLACNSNPQSKCSGQTRPHSSEYARQLERTRAAAFSKIHETRDTCRAHILLGKSDERQLSGPYSPHAASIVSELLRQVSRSDRFSSAEMKFELLPTQQQIGSSIDQFQSFVLRARKIVSDIQWGENASRSEALFFVEETLSNIEDYIAYQFELLSFEVTARHFSSQTMAAATGFFEKRPMSDPEKQARLFERLHHLQTQTQNIRPEKGNVVRLFAPRFMFEDPPWSIVARDNLTREIYGSVAPENPSLPFTTNL